MSNQSDWDPAIKERALEAGEKIRLIQAEMSKNIVGHDSLMEQIIICLMCRGHALLEGVPGLGKTFLIKTFGEVLDLSTTRIQFTPDLMPADIIGTNVLVRDEQGNQLITFQKGPIFSQILLADEINRATPKTQSALLEAMQEKNVTVAGQSYPLGPPFIVLATQNPIEMEGTYPLPEAQLDRFFFKLKVEYPNEQELLSIIDRTTGYELQPLRPVLAAEEIAAYQKTVRAVPVSAVIREYAARLVFATHPGRQGSPEEVNRFVRYGSSPRGAQSLVLAAKVYALLDGRFNVSFDDIRRAALPSLRHRLILSFQGEAEGIDPDTVITKAIAAVPEAV